MKLTDKVLRRIQRMSMPVPFSGCVIWLGSVNNDGYPRMNFYHGRRPDGTSDSRSALVHRLIAQTPPDKECDHECCVRCCINRAHLRNISHQENCSAIEQRKRFRWRNWTAEIS